MKIGAFTGKFYPPHIGHISAIDYSLKFCDKVIVVISKNDKRNEYIFKTSGFEILDANLIKQWFQKYYKDETRVSIEIMDENDLEPYPKNPKEWTEKFKKQFPQVNVKIADESYREFNEKYFPECEFLPINRDNISIHSTDLRDNLQENFEYLIPTAKDYFKKKLGL